MSIIFLLPAPGAIHADAIIMDGDSPEDVMRMTWSPPYQPNGPISEYLLRFVWDYGNGPHSETARVPRNQLSYEQKFACNGTVVKVNYTVTAINVDKKGVQHLGAPSETRFYNICSSKAVLSFCQYYLQLFESLMQSALFLPSETLQQAGQLSSWCKEHAYQPDDWESGEIS